MMGTALGLLGTGESLVLSIFPLLGAEIVVQSKQIESGFSLMSYFYSFVGKGVG